jgi:hypothetical protein
MMVWPTITTTMGPPAGAATTPSSKQGMAHGDIR